MKNKYIIPYHIIPYHAIPLLIDCCHQGFRTGHVYREPLYKKDVRKDRLNSEVEIPPASSSFSDMFDDDGKLMYVFIRVYNGQTDVCP